VSWLRLVALVAFLGLLLLLGLNPSTRDYFSVRALRTLVADARTLGLLIFVAAFLVGQFLYIPGMVFVGVAVWVWGPWLGFAIGYSCGVLGVNLHFLSLRLIGGRPLAANARTKRPRWSWVQKALGALEAHPIREVILLRSLMFMSPPLNMALALTGVRGRDHLIGSALGLILPVAAAVGLVELFLGP